MLSRTGCLATSLRAFNASLSILMLSGTHFTKVLWAHHSHLVNTWKKKKKTLIWLVPNLPMSSAVMTCSNLGPDLMIRTIITAKRICSRFQFWTHKPYVKWVPGQFNSTKTDIVGLVQERHNLIATTLELCLSCTKPWNCDHAIMAVPL